ncbi:MAG: FeoB-associated Cys-rich membrane protein [Clostridiales bacterium]|nr:FeoB-associated Cys-rich membrane protein [Clostridiales bacterium]
MNPQTIVILILLTAAIAAIIIYMIKSKKSGKPSCGCNCKGCSMHGNCHKK